MIAYRDIRDYIVKVPMAAVVEIRVGDGPCGGSVAMDVPQVDGDVSSHDVAVTAAPSPEVHPPEHGDVSQAVDDTHGPAKKHAMEAKAGKNWVGWAIRSKGGIEREGKTGGREGRGETERGGGG